MVSFLTALFEVSISSSDHLTMDSIIGKSLLVAHRVGGEVKLFAVVTADPCPTIQWRVNGSAINRSGVYTIDNPCSTSPAGATSFNFTLTITATSATAGTYNAVLTNAVGTREVPDVFVTPPGISMLPLLVPHSHFCFLLFCFLQFQ